MGLRDYLTDSAGFDWARLLSPWAWLLPERARPWLMNRFGDVFLAFPDGTVRALALDRGVVEEVAASREEFCQELGRPGNADSWLLVPLADRAVAAGVRPGHGECYGYRLPPVLGGGYCVENLAVLPVGQHLGFSGELHRQLFDVADGDYVRIVRKSDAGPPVRCLRNCCAPSPCRFRAAR